MDQWLSAKRVILSRLSFAVHSVPHRDAQVISFVESFLGRVLLKNHCVVLSLDDWLCTIIYIENLFSFSRCSIESDSYFLSDVEDVIVPRVSP